MLQEGRIEEAFLEWARLPSGEGVANYGAGVFFSVPDAAPAQSVLDVACRHVDNDDAQIAARAMRLVIYAFVRDWTVPRSVVERALNRARREPVRSSLVNRAVYIAACWGEEDLRDKAMEVAIAFLSRVQLSNKVAARSWLRMFSPQGVLAREGREILHRIMRSPTGRSWFRRYESVYGPLPAEFREQRCSATSPAQEG